MWCVSLYSLYVFLFVRLFVFISKSFFSQKQVKTFNWFPVWRSKGIRLFVLFEILTICIPDKVLLFTECCNTITALDKAEQSFCLFSSQAHFPQFSISQGGRRNLSVLRGPHSIADADMQVDTGICSFSPAPLGVDHPHQHSDRPPVILLHFTERRLPPAVGRWERGKWTRVYFEHLSFHIFTEKSKNSILILNPRKRYRDTARCKWSRVRGEQATQNKD